jgi:hypothetical protein
MISGFDRSRPEKAQSEQILSALPPKADRRADILTQEPTAFGGAVSGYGVHHPLTHAASENER